MPLRHKIFLALLLITLPVIVIAFQNISTVQSLVRNSPRFSEHAGLLLEELLSIESKIEKLGLKMSSNTSSGKLENTRVLSEVRTSLSIVENILRVHTTRYSELGQLRRCIDHFAEIIERCSSSCASELKNIHREQTFIDESAEALIRNAIGTITSDYRTLKNQIEQGNTRGEWSLISLFILLLGGSYFLSQGLTKQIVSLQQATHGMLNGDLTVPLPAPSQDEIGELIRAFEGMRTNLTNSMVTRRYLEALLTELGEGVIVTNSTGEIEVANPAACKLLDGALDPLSGIRYSIRDSSHFSLQSNNTPLTIVTYNNDTRLLIVTSAPLIDENNVVVGHVHGIRDVTEKIELEKNLATHREQLARGERIMALGTLGAIVAHKLSQPISSTRLFLQQALREVDTLSTTGNLKDTLSEALGEVSRISHTVTKMMRLERTRAGTNQHTPSVDAISSIRNVIESIGEMKNRLGAEITLRLPNFPVFVACRHIEFEELMYCLVTNALQARAPSRAPRIKIELVQSDERASISVTDNGTGISEQSIDSIFDCFFTTKTEENGTGLGLAIVRHIVESNGGTVRVVSEVNCGSTFILELPLAFGESDAETHDSLHC